MENSIRQTNEKNKSILFVVLISCAAALGGALYGYDTAVISGATLYIKDLYHLTSAMQGFVTSSIMIGGVIGVAVSGFLGDAIGRKQVLMIAAILFAINAVISALSPTVTILIIARIIGGLGIGLASALSVTYISECAPPRFRGRLSSIYQLFVVLGIVITYIVNYVIISGGTYEWEVTRGWRYMLICGIVPAMIFFITLFFVPASPRFLIRKGRAEEARKILTKINGEEIAEKEIKEISKSLNGEQHSSIRELFKPNLRKAMYVGIFLALFNQVIGMNSIFYYGPEVFQMIGFKNNASFFATIITGVVQIFATLLAIYLIDRVGRKKLMAIGSALMAIFMLLIGGVFYFRLFGNAYLVLALILGFIISFCISMGPIPWIMIPEIFPNHLRARAAGITAIFLWGANWAIGQFTPMLLTGIGGAYTFWIFCIINIIGFVIVTTKVPETKNKTLEEMKNFGKKNKSFHVNDYKQRREVIKKVLIVKEIKR